MDGWLDPLFVTRRCDSPVGAEGTSKMACRENSFICVKEAFCLCMNVSVHGFPARLVFFINVLIQVRMLQNTSMGSRDYIT